MKKTFKFKEKGENNLTKRGNYKTKQRELILECIRNHRDQYGTIQQISEYLEKKNCRVGQTTIYRTLDMLVKEKKITRVSIDGIKGACYRYLPTEEDSYFFSMKCEQCGEVIDIECPELQKLYIHLSAEHHLKIDYGKTMFYGDCDKCGDIHYIPEAKHNHEHTNTCE